MIRSVDVERAIAGLDAELRRALLLSAEYTCSEASSRLAISEETLVVRVREAKRQLLGRLLGSDWKDAESEFVIDVYIDAAATRMQRRSQGFGYRVQRWCRAAVGWQERRESLWRRVEFLGLRGEWGRQLGVGVVATLVLVLAIWGAVDPGPPTTEGGGAGETVLRAGLSVEDVGATGASGGATDAVPRDARRPGALTGFANAAGAIGIEVGGGRGGSIVQGAWGSDIEDKWQDDVVGRWREMGDGKGTQAIRRETEDNSALIEELWEEMRELWASRVSFGSPEGGAFRRQVGTFVDGSRDGGAAAWDCVDEKRAYATGWWKVMEEGRRGLEVRRRELEVERRALEVERREWGVKRREMELRRRKLELLRNRAEGARLAVEDASRPDREEYWHGMREYAEVLDEYAIALENESEVVREYREFMIHGYAAGQQGYVDGMAEVIWSYSKLLWGCEAQRSPRFM